jgi:NDP-sugar pyrophosphorylase family protein
MPNELTEAVRRLRQLQQDVDRLKSGGDDGEVRELRSVSANTVTRDSVTVGPDALIDQTTRSSDDVVLGPTAVIDEGVGIRDAPDTDVTQADGLAYGSAEYDQDGYS